jgi:hypothetical protein
VNGHSHDRRACLKGANMIKRRPQPEAVWYRNNAVWKNLAD